VDSEWSVAAEVADASCPHITFKVLELDGYYASYSGKTSERGFSRRPMSGASLLVCNYMLGSDALVHQECMYIKIASEQRPIPEKMNTRITGWLTISYCIDAVEEECMTRLYGETE